MRAVIFLLVFAVISASALMCMCVQTETVKTHMTPTPVNTAPAPAETPTPAPAKALAKATQNATICAAEATRPIGGECLGCHYNPKTQYIPQVDKIPGHLNATKYCIYCHVPGVLHKTKKQIDACIAAMHHNTTWAKEDKCSYCHKTISTASMKNCGLCHGYPNPVEPSHGNVFVIHSPHGVDCQDCHGNNFIAIHYYHIAFPPQFPIPNSTS